MEIYLLTPKGDQLVVQVVDGQVIVPPVPASAPAPPAPGVLAQ